MRTLKFALQEWSMRHAKDVPEDRAPSVLRSSLSRMDLGTVLLDEDPPDLEAGTELWKALEALGFELSELEQANDQVLTAVVLPAARARFRTLRERVISRLDLLREGSKELVPWLPPLCLLSKEERVEFLSLMRIELDLDPEAEPELLEWAWRMQGALPVPSMRLLSALEAEQERRDLRLTMETIEASEKSRVVRADGTEVLEPVRPNVYDGPSFMDLELGPERPAWRQKRFLPWRKPWGRPITWRPELCTKLGLNPEEIFQRLLDTGVFVEGSLLRCLTVYLGPMEPRQFVGLKRLCPPGVLPVSLFDRPPSRKSGALEMLNIFEGVAEKLRDSELWPKAVMVNKVTDRWVAFWSFEEEPLVGFPEQWSRLWVQMAVEEVSVGWLAKGVLNFVRSQLRAGLKWKGARLSGDNRVKLLFEDPRGKELFGEFVVSFPAFGEIAGKKGAGVPVELRSVDKNGVKIGARVILRLGD